MTKQEEIREGIAHDCRCGNCQNGYIMFQGKRSRKCYQCYKGYKLDVNAILSYLHSQDVVIKVDRALPRWELEGIGSLTENAIYRVAQKDMAGYVAVEPLVKE